MKIHQTIAASAIVLATLGMNAANASTELTGAMTADNAFFAFLGTSAGSLGTLIGEGNSWPSSFSLTPTDLTPGVTNYLNIEAINYGGPGGFQALLSLSSTDFEFANGTQTLSTDPSDIPSWTATYNSPNYSVAIQPWVAATGAVVPDFGYSWGNQVGSPLGGWIDAASNGLNVCQLCTVDFTTAIISTVSAVPEPATWAMFLVGFGGIGFMMRNARRKSAAATT
jgi:hypothetical protein